MRALGVPFIPAFVLAGTVPIVAALVTIVVARMPRDEIDNPLDVPVEVRHTAVDGAAASPPTAQ